MSSDSAVTSIALALACFFFFSFWGLTARQLKDSKGASATVNDAVDSLKAESLVGLDIGKLVENAAKLIDSLAKAGPCLSALGASVLSLAIAAYVNKTPDPKAASTEVAKPGSTGK